jgi:hypothetical protein
LKETWVVSTHQQHFYLLTKMDVAIGAALAPVAVLGFDAGTGQVELHWLEHDRGWEARLASFMSRCADQPAAMTEMDIEEWAERANGISWDITEVACPVPCTELSAGVELVAAELA